jgi:hypothetical protein
MTSRVTQTLFPLHISKTRLSMRKLAILIDTTPVKVVNVKISRHLQHVFKIHKFIYRAEMSTHSLSLYGWPPKPQSPTSYTRSHVSTNDQRIAYHVS